MPNPSQKDSTDNILKDKKILFLITQTKWGGAQKYVLELAKYFSRRNEIHIAYGEIKNENKNFLDACHKLKIKTIPLEYLVRNIDPAKDVLAIIDIVKLLNSDNYNVLHINSSKAGIIASLAAKVNAFNPMSLKLGVIYTAHGFVFNEPLSKRRQRLYRISERVSTALQHAVITVSDYDKQTAIDNHITDEYKIFTIHNGINPDEYKFLSRQDAQSKLQLSADKKYFVTIASFYQTKGHKYLLEAIKKLADSNNDILNDHRFVLIGSGPELAGMKELSAKLELDRYLKFIAAGDNDWQYLKAFEYFILASVKEGLPYTILEAGLAQIPVIATKVGGIPEIIKDGQTGLLVTPANPLALADAISKIADANLSSKLADNNYQNILKNFSLARTIAQTEEVYLKLF